MMLPTYINPVKMHENSDGVKAETIKSNWHQQIKSGKSSTLVTRIF